VQCLEDFGIPVFLGHRVTAIHGPDRVSAVTIEPVGGGAKRTILCDTLVVSAGLIPENELSEGADVPLDESTLGPVVSQQMATLREGVFAAGDVVYVHNLVDHVTEEAETAGRAAAAFVRGGRASAPVAVEVAPGDGVRLVCPQRVDATDEPVTLWVRVARPLRPARLEVTDASGGVVASRSFRVARPAELVAIELKSPSAVRGRVLVRAVGEPEH
jgi:hypothetical protein